ncbi:MAG TPA: hypothetical protein VKA84_23270 [Gemmatimonadaceae bacterium]|nr:hypothetical protein [Gemmatimonadaceae bacterium]
MPLLSNRPTARHLTPLAVVGQFEGSRRDGNGDCNGILTGCTGW